ncbi:MAG: NADPH-dependent 7-cyano-7-deazaguanine reductase QueF [Ignavibacteriales bacterium]|nr:NADPH-dependent 7-cyano-7-deazaguanine reductase QueF [Ignavibacteriales bacterium]
MKKKQIHSPQQTKIQPLGKSLPFDGYEKINAKELGTFPYEHIGKDIIINIDTDEFTAVCPFSGLPDFATIKVNYIPRKEIIELRSFKYYLLSYRTVGIYQEHLVNRVLDDLVKCCKPKWMEVIADYNIRGGVHTIASVVFGKK